jgi:hypothetical protein
VAGASVAGASVAAGSVAAGGCVAAPPPQAVRTIEATIINDRTYISFFMVSFLLVLVFGFDRYYDRVMNIRERAHLLREKLVAQD